MLGGRKEKHTMSEKIDTLIGKSTVLEGNIKAQGMVKIDGYVKGEITTKGELVIGKDGKIEATSRADRVTISGKITGDVVATTGITITSTGALYGNAETASLVIEDGAIFQGTSAMTKKQIIKPEELKSDNKKGKI